MVHLFRRGSTLDQALDVRNVEVLVEYCFWYSLGQAVQGGFAIAACMMVGLTFTAGVVQSAV